MKYFAISFIAGVFLFLYIVFPIMDALEVPRPFELLGIFIAQNPFWIGVFGSLLILIFLGFLYKLIKRRKYV